MKIPQTLPISAEQSRAARFHLGMSQAEVIKQSNLPGHKLKNFETGRFVPDMAFLRQLHDFYVGLGVDLSEDTGQPAQLDQPAPNQAVKLGGAMVRIDPSLTDEEVGNIFDHIERNEERISAILGKEVEHGFLGLSNTAEANHASALRLLAENGTLFAKLLSRPLVDAPSPDLVSGKVKPKTHAELLACTQAHMHGAIQGDKEAVAKHKAEKTPQTLSESIFG